MKDTIKMNVKLKKKITLKNNKTHDVGAIILMKGCTNTIFSGVEAIDCKDGEFNYYCLFQNGDEVHISKNYLEFEKPKIEKGVKTDEKD